MEDGLLKYFKYLSTSLGLREFEFLRVTGAKGLAARIEGLLVAAVRLDAAS